MEIKPLIVFWERISEDIPLSFLLKRIDEFYLLVYLYS